MAADVARTIAVRHTFAFAVKQLKFCMEGHPMFWIFLEIALGLALFVFLVWWTLPKKEKDDLPEE